MPMPGARVHPGGFEFVLLSEEGVGDHKIVFDALGQEEDPIGVDVPYTLFPNDTSPRSVIPSYSGIKVPQKDDFVFFGDTRQDAIQTGVEGFLDIIL